MTTSMAKKRKQELMSNLLKTHPFISDEDLSERMSLSIQTIRLYRMQMGIPELRVRIKKAALENNEKIQGVASQDILGEIIELEVGKAGISILKTTQGMAFEDSDVIKGHYIFSMAESLALSVIDKKSAITGIANMKYNKVIKVGETLVAKALVSKERITDYIVHVKINVNREEVFRGKFRLIPIE